MGLSALSPLLIFPPLLSGLFWGWCKSMIYLLNSLGILFREWLPSYQKPGDLKPGHGLLFSLSSYFYLFAVDRDLLRDYCRFDHGICFSSFPCLFSSNFFAILWNKSVKSGICWNLDLPHPDHFLLFLFYKTLLDE